MGDFDLAYNGELINQKFPPTLSVEPMRYESYQPPLYYLTAAPIYGAVAGFGQANLGKRTAEQYGTALIALRLYGVLLAAISLGLIYLCAAAIFPVRPTLSIGATAFAAALPMHAAMTAAVNNDTLAELLILASTLTLLRWMQTVNRPVRAVEMARPRSVPSLSEAFLGRARVGLKLPASRETRQLLTLGLLLGLGLLTKIYVYALLPICLLMILLITWRMHPINRIRHSITNICWTLIPALLLGLPMWIRNMWLYGLFDPLGLAWHDRVVAGQPTLADWIAQYGWSAYWERAISFTFRSFWGVFGWLSVFLDERIYTLLTLFSAIVAFGVLWAVGRIMLRKSGAQTFNEFQRWSLLFLALMLLMVLACYGLYNTKFVQHQGRYLFWGLLPIGLLVAAGWRELQRRGAGIGAGIFTIVLTIWLSTNGLSQLNPSDINKWTLLSGAIITLLLLSHSLLFNKINGAIIFPDIDPQKSFVPSLLLEMWYGTFLDKYRIARQPLVNNMIGPLYFTLPFVLLLILSIMAIMFTIKPNLSHF